MNGLIDWQSTEQTTNFKHSMVKYNDIPGEFAGILREAGSIPGEQKWGTFGEFPNFKKV